MIINIIKESQYLDYYTKIINNLNIEIDILYINGNQITLFFFDKMSEFHNCEKIKHNYSTIKKIENYFYLKNNLYIDSMLINRGTDDERWIDDLYAYEYEIKLDEMRSEKINDLLIN